MGIFWWCFFSPAIGWSQPDTVYAGLIVEGEYIDLSPDFECLLIYSQDTISIPFQKTFLLIPPLDKEKKYELLVRYKTYCLRFDPFAIQDFKNRIEFVIDLTPFEEENVQRIRRKKRLKYLYYYLLSPNFSIKKQQENARNGILYPTLRSKVKGGYD